MMLQMYYYPDALFALLSPVKAVRESAMKNFQLDWGCFCTAKTLGEPSLSKQVERSPFNGRVVQDLARLARAASWDVDKCPADV